MRDRWFVRLRALIIAAGPTLKRYGFPSGSKPKPLFHVDGETILMRQVRLLKSANINKIMVITGYKSEMIEKYVEENQLDLNLRHLKKWTDSLETVLLGLDESDDILIIFGDVFLTQKGLNAILEARHPFVMSHYKKDSNYTMFKCDKEKVKLLRDLRKFTVQHTSPGIRLLYTLVNMFTKNNAVSVPHHGTRDIDYFRETDERKI